MIHITVSHDGTLTRSGARIMREAGAVGVTGSTTLAQARKVAREFPAFGFVFVSATTGAPAKARRRAAVAQRPASTGFVREQIRANTLRREALALLADLSA